MQVQEIKGEGFRHELSSSFDSSLPRAKVKGEKSYHPNFRMQRQFYPWDCDHHMLLNKSKDSQGASSGKECTRLHAT